MDHTDPLMARTLERRTNGQCLSNAKTYHIYVS